MIRRLAVIACLLLTAVLGAADGAWVAPVTWSDPEGKWVDVPLSWDDSTASYAADQSNRAGDGPWLELQFATAIRTDRVLVNADFGFGIVDAVDLEARGADGTWTRLHHGVVANCADDILTFPALTTDTIRFRFHYLTAGYYFWLYNLAAFALPASVELPQVATGAATSVTASTAALHGTIVSDGGEPCAYRFRYHALGAEAWTETPWGGAAVSGQGGSSVLLPVTGLQSGTTYAYHIQARNSVGVATGADIAFTPQPVALGSVEWLAASDVAAAGANGMTWDAVVNALDDDAGTAARCYHPLWATQWGPDLTFSLPAVEIDHVRLSAGVNPFIDAVAVEVRATVDAAWTPLYQGAFQDRTWLVLPLPARATYAQARVRFHVTTTGVGTNWELFEFQVRMPPLVSFASGADRAATATGLFALPLRLQPATSTLPITLTLAAGGTAVLGMDWQAGGVPGQLVIPAGSPAPSIDVEVLTVTGTGTATATISISEVAAGRVVEPTVGTVTITRSTNGNLGLPPVPHALAIAGNEDTVVNGLASATDGDGDVLTWSVQTQAVTGIASVDPGTGAVTFTPAADWHGQTTFVLAVSDGRFSVPLTVEVTVAPVNDPPVAIGGTQLVFEDSFQQLIQLAGSDADDDPLDLPTVVAGPLHGTLEAIGPPGGAVMFLYTPDRDYDGPDSVTFTVSDGIAVSAPATVTILVVPVNDAPTVAVAAATTAADPTFAATVPLSVLGADDGGEPGLSYTWTAVDATGVTFGAEQGTNAGKGITATVPGPGAYTFSVLIRDEAGLTVSSAVTVNVAFPAPTATPAGTHFSAATAITLAKAQPDGVIRYTLDDTDPTSASAIVTGPITISASGVLTARVFRDGWEPSPAYRAAYIVDAGPGDPFPPAPEVTATITAGLTGDTEMTVGTETVYLSNATSVTVTVAVGRPAGCETVSITVNGVPAELTASGGRATLALPDAEHALVATAVVRNALGNTASGSSAATRLLVDRQIPQAQVIDPDDAATALGVGLLSAGGQPLVVNGQPAGSGAVVIGTWRAWPAADLVLPLRITSQAGLAATGSTVMVGDTSLSVTPAASVAGGGLDLLQASGFANVADAVTPDAGSLVLTSDAGVQTLRVHAVDRCGNVLDQDLCSVWKKSSAGEARFAYVQRQADGFPTSIGLLNAEQGSQLGTQHLLATAADIVAVDQDGTPLLRLSPASGWSDLVDSGPVLWQLQPVEAEEPVGDDQVRNLRCTVVLRDLAGNLAGTAQAPLEVLTVWKPPLVEPPVASVEVEEIEREVWWTTLHYLGWHLYSGQGYMSWPAMDGVMEVTSSLWINPAEYWFNVGAVGTGTAVVAPLSLGPEQPAEEAPYRFDWEPEPPPGSEPPVNRSETLHGQPERVRYATVATRPGLKVVSSTEFMATIGGRTQVLFELQESRPEAGSKERPILAGTFGDDRKLFGNVTVTQTIEGDMRTGAVAWNRVLDRTTPLVLNVPASWAASASAGYLPATTGRVEWSTTGAPAQSVLPGADQCLEISLTRDLPGGFARVQRQQSASESTPESYQHLGFRALNLVKVVNDVVAAGSGSKVFLEGGFQASLSAAAPELASGGTVRLLLSSRRVWAEGHLAGLGARTLADLDLIDAWLTVVEEESTGDLSAVSGVSDGADAAALTQRLLMGCRELSRGLEAAIPVGGPAEVYALYEDQTGLVPEAEIVRSMLDEAFPPETMTEITATATQARTEAETAFDTAVEAFASQPAAASTAQAAAAAFAKRLAAAHEQAAQLRTLLAGWEDYSGQVQEAFEVYVARLLPSEQGLRNAIEAWNTATKQGTVPLEDRPVWVARNPEEYYGQFYSFEEGWRQAQWERQQIRAEPDYVALKAAQEQIESKPFAVALAASAVEVISAIADRVLVAGEPALTGLISVGTPTPEGADPGVAMRQVYGVTLGGGEVGVYDMEINIGDVHAYPDELSQQYAGANGAHRMKEALAVINVDCLAGHRFGSIHMKKVFRKDPQNAYLDQYSTQQGSERFEIGRYWFVTDKIGQNDPNFGIFETGPINSDFQYTLDGCTKVGPQMYAQYQWMLDAMNATRRWLALLLNQPAPVDYTITDFFNFVMSSQGYSLDQQKVSEGRYWQSPGYTQTGDNVITGSVIIRGKNIPVQLHLEVHQFTVRIDYNDDRKVTSDDDALKDSQPMKFWVNNNTGYNEGVLDDGTNDIPAGGDDGSDDHVNGVRDLIDFAPVCIVMDSGLMKMLNDERSRYVVKGRYTNGSGRIALYPISSALVRGGDDSADGSCLTNGTVARQAIQKANNNVYWRNLLSGHSQPSDFSYSTETWMLLEGTELGDVEFELDINDVRSGISTEADKIKMSLKNAYDYFVTFNANTELVGNYPEYINAKSTSKRYSTMDPVEGRSFSDLQPGSNVILFIHGFNVDFGASGNWSSETYKRLYWTGFKGDMVCLHWNGADGIWDTPPLNFNGNIQHAMETAGVLAKFMPQLTANHNVTILSHSAGTVVALETLRLLAVADGGQTKITNLISMESATFQNVFKIPLLPISGSGMFDNISHNNWFRPSLMSITGRYENFYSADDKTLSFWLCTMNENGVNLNNLESWGKLLGHAMDTQTREEMQLVPRDAERIANYIPGIHSLGADEFGVKCVIPHNTPALGNAPCPGHENLDCQPEGYGINNGGRWPGMGRNRMAGSHSFLRESNYYETYRTFRRIKEIVQ